MANFKAKFFKQSAYLFSIMLLASCGDEYGFNGVNHINFKVSQLEFSANKLLTKNNVGD